MTDNTFEQIVAELEQPSALYAAVLAALQQGSGETTETIGRRAWMTLDLFQQSEALTELVENYTRTVAFEEADKTGQQHADAMDKLDTCLEEFDVDCAWDSVATHGGTAPDENEVVLERDVLVRLLDEIGRLQRRVDQAPAPAPDAV